MIKAQQIVISLAVLLVILSGCGGSGGSVPIQTNQIKATVSIPTAGVNITALRVYVSGHQNESDYLVATVSHPDSNNKFEFTVPNPGEYDLLIDCWVLYTGSDTIGRWTSAFTGYKITAPETDLGEINDLNVVP